MNVQIKYVFSICCLLVGFMGLLLSHTKEAKFTSDPLLMTDFISDIYAENVVLKIFDRSGQLIKHIETPFITYDLKSKQANFTYPKLTLYKEHEMPWIITSDQGQAVNEFKTITLNEHVHLHQPQGPHTKHTVITTDQMTYEPSQNFAYTNKPVQFKQQGRTVQAVGLKAYLNEERVELLSKAKGYYARP